MYHRDSDSDCVDQEWLWASPKMDVSVPADFLRSEESAPQIQTTFFDFIFSIFHVIVFCFFLKLSLKSVQFFPNYMAYSSYFMPKMKMQL